MGYFAGVSGLPGAVHGYMDVVLHPRFADNSFVYLAYMKPLDATRRTLAIARGRWDGKGLADTKDIYVCSEDVGSATRLAFGRDNTLFVVGVERQSAGELAGPESSWPARSCASTTMGAFPRTIRTSASRTRSLRCIRSVIATRSAWRSIRPPERSGRTRTVRTAATRSTSSVPGHNYGWPIISLGRAYTGPWQSQKFSQDGIDNPIVYWTPAIAVSGMTFYTGDKLAKWKGDIFVGSLRTGEIPGTGHLERILFNEKMEELRRETLLTDLRQRIRDVRQGPDGFLYVITDEKEGAVLRIEPQ